MATLRLVSIRCAGLAEEASVELTPLFLDKIVSPLSGQTSITVTGSSPIDFAPDTQAVFFVVDGFLYLITPDEAWFCSKDIMWTTATTVDVKETSFKVLYDPTGSYSNLDPYLCYELKIGVFALILTTIQTLAFRLVLFVQSLFTILILKPFRLIVGRNDKDKKERSQFK